MGNKLISMSQYAVRIATNGGEELKGSGVIFKRNIGEDVLIFTAAHVIDAVFANQKEVTKELYLSFTDGLDEYKIIQVTAKIVSDTVQKSKEGYIYIHPEYNNSTLKNDAAIIVVSWKNWMATLNNLRTDECTLDAVLKGWGFPASMNKEWRKDSKGEVAGKKDLCGKSVVREEKRFSVSYSIDAQAIKVKREVMMNGFSGSGLFEVREGKSVLVGVISKECGDETAGYILWASEINIFYEVMDKYGLKAAIPDSFNEYKESILNFIPKIRKNARVYFNDKADELIEDEKLVPKEVISEERDFYNDLICEGRRENCADYWEGQLKKSVIVFALAGVPKEKLSHPILQMPAPYLEDNVYSEFLCTEEAAEDVICRLIHEDYFSSTGQFLNGTIFIWNGKSSSKSYTCLFSRKICRDIIVNIADDYVSVRMINKKFKNLIADEQEQYSFDIIKGAVSQCNIAMIGVGKLMEIIEQGDGVEEKMKFKMEGVLKEVWEV